jgi:phosphoribosyl 1,2-cyclic phosphodiesterase
MTDFSDLPPPAIAAAPAGLPGPSQEPSEPGFTATFWGVRGSVPSPGAHTIRYGGNTACVEVNVGGKQLVFDGGTGLLVLGEDLRQRGQPVDAALFFTHSHWDRIQGFPFFLPAFDPATRLNIYGAAALNGASIKQRLMNQMLRPNFFTPLQTMQANMAFHNIQAGSTIHLDDVAIDTISLNSQTNALGFRVTWAGHTLVYATDTDHTQDAADPNLLFLADGADVLIFDGTYADMAYADPAPNPVIPYKLGIQVVQAARVEQLVLFHHNPRHDDDQLDRLEQEVRSHLPNTRLAHEGMTLRLV